MAAEENSTGEKTPIRELSLILYEPKYDQTQFYVEAATQMDMDVQIIPNAPPQMIIIDSDDSDAECEEMPQMMSIKQLSDLLSTAFLGPFSFGGPCNDLWPLPSLHIKDVGPVSFPLSAEQASKVIDAAAQEYEGVWHIDASDLSVRNPLFMQGLTKLKAEIGVQLQRPGLPLELTLRKLLILQPGASIPKSGKRSAENGVFGTLMIQLPSNHCGGQLKVYQKLGADEEEIVHDFGPSMAHVCHYAFHFVHAETELTSILGGYSGTLVYSVCWPPDSVEMYKVPSLDLAACMAEELKAIRGEEEFFMLLLSHEYTANGFDQVGKSSLQGIDRSRVDVILAANGQLNPEQQFQFYMVNGTRQIIFQGKNKGSTNIVIWNMNEESVHFNWFGLDGKEERTLQRGFKLKKKIYSERNMLKLDEKDQIWVEKKVTLDESRCVKEAMYGTNLLLALPLKVSSSFIARYMNFEGALICAIRQSVDERTIASFLHTQVNQLAKSSPYTAVECLRYLIARNFVDPMLLYFKAFEHNLFEVDIKPEEKLEVQNTLIELMKSALWESAMPHLFSLLLNVTDFGDEVLELLKVAQASGVDSHVRSLLMNFVYQNAPLTDLEDPNFLTRWWKIVLNEDIDQLERFAVEIAEKLSIDHFLQLPDDLNEPSITRFLMKGMMAKITDEHFKNSAFIDRIWSFYWYEARNELLDFCSEHLTKAPLQWIADKAKNLNNSPSLRITLLNMVVPLLTQDEVLFGDVELVKSTCAALLNAAAEGEAGKSLLESFINASLRLLTVAKLHLLLDVLLACEEPYKGNRALLKYMIKSRRDWLTKQLALHRSETPVPSALLAIDVEIEKFINSGAKSTSIKHGKFPNGAVARNFAAQFAPYSHLLSVQVCGSGGNVYLLVAKTSKLINALQWQKARPDFEDELVRLKNAAFAGESREKDDQEPPAKKAKLED